MNEQFNPILEVHFKDKSLDSFRDLVSRLTDGGFNFASVSEPTFKTLNERDVYVCIVTFASVPKNWDDSIKFYQRAIQIVDESISKCPNVAYYRLSCFDVGVICAS